jgi:hypothetical protein
MTISKVSLMGFMGLLMFGLTACAPEVGSEKWCKSIEKKPQGDITMDEAKNYATNCLFK